MNIKSTFKPAFCLILFIVSIACTKQNEIFIPSDYGLTFENSFIHVKVWSPDAEKVTLKIYRDCLSEKPVIEKPLGKLDSGDWHISIPDSLYGYSYTFSLLRNGEESREVVDPFVKSTCANGSRGAFINISRTSPEEWSQDRIVDREEFDPLVIYELHVRDFSIDPDAGFEHKGKYLAFTENKKKGLKHISGLGITHIHLLPVFDFASIDETLEEPNYNWGYDPQNYLVPEGSYSTEPNDPESRIREFKSMVKAIHDKNIGVIMDVVYNHTYYLDNSSFQEWAPGYYYRKNEDGSYSNASACGNELATEKEKVREMIIESLKFWMREYHIDGFRFDLMGIMDIPTMNIISSELQKINPGVVLYGEGWLAGSSPLPDSLRAVKANMSKISGIAAFSDEIRDGIKGHWSDEKDKGFVSGKADMKPSVKFGIAGGSKHPQIDYSRVNNSDFPWADDPWQCINYVSCHDNHTLFDKLEISAGEFNIETRKKMHLLAQTIVLSSVGIPFLHAGTEFFRTKYGDHNSFESPDSVNMIDWSLADENKESVDYIRQLIEFRKRNDAFWMNNNDELQENLEFMDENNPGIICYSLSGNGGVNGFEKALFIFASVNTDTKIELPEGKWELLFDSFKKTDTRKYFESELEIKGPNAMILSLQNPQ